MSTATIIESARSQGRIILSEVEAKQILAEAGIPVVETRLAKTPEDAVAIANELGYPVALKIVSPQITHKSDVGGVRLNVADARGVVLAFEEIVNNARRAVPDATIEGVSVQRMAKPGVEVIIGMTKDPQFGPVLMFGLGGVLVEVLKDVAFRIVPLAPRDAKQMIREIKGYPLLEGYRGQPPCDVSALEQMLLRLSEFVDAHPEIAELDLNPVFAYPDGAVAVDARVVLEKEG
ncbi:MAG TPA: acetate--CoA ligase family protein [Dehalococcoidia bacterium]|nr:acetate--CoA ligase family protein [Dehalococcoidia bacterium]